MNFLNHILKEAKSERTKTGYKVPGKYLTKDKADMKDEIERVRDLSPDDSSAYGKWKADYSDKGKKKKYKTKKSKATIAYEKKFGKKDESFISFLEAQVVPDTIAFDEKQIDVFKDYGAKFSTNGQEMFVPVSILQDLRKHEASSNFKKDFKEAMDYYKMKYASVILSLTKKKLETSKEKINIKGQAEPFIVIKGRMSKNGNFYFKTGNTNKIPDETN